MNIEMAQMAEPPRLVLFAKNGEASCTVTLLPYVSSFVTLSDTRLPISRLGRVFAVLTSIASAVQINVRRALCFPHVHNRYLWDDNTRLHAYSNRHLCLFSFTPTYPARIAAGTDVWREKI